MAYSVLDTNALVANVVKPGNHEAPADLVHGVGSQKIICIQSS